jgi:hypothetical protein
LIKRDKYGSIYSYRKGGGTLGTAVKKTISLPPELAREAENIAREEGKTLSGIIQESLRIMRARRLKKDFKELQDYWSRKAKKRGILTDKQLEKYLKK